MYENIKQTFADKQNDFFMVHDKIKSEIKIYWNWGQQNERRTKK